MTRFLTAVVGITMVAGLAACGDDTLFNAKPPYPSSSYGSSGTTQPSPNGTATPSAQPAPGAEPTRRTTPGS